MAKSRKTNVLTPALAGLLAWVIPGAGHLYIRRTLRGIILCVCINGLFWTGVAFGGVFTVDPHGQRWWFVAQACTGASGMSAWYRQKHVRDRIIADLGIGPRPAARQARRWNEEYTDRLIEEKLALTYPTDNVSRAYTGIAGMLNLMVIFDAVMLAGMGHFGEPPAEKKEDAGEGEA